MARLALTAIAFILGGCAVDRVPYVVQVGTPAPQVEAQMGKPTVEGVAANGDRYWDYSTQPLGYYNYRVTFGPDDRVRDVQNLVTQKNADSVEPGMTRAQVMGILGPSKQPERYANATSAWTWRYFDGGIHKLAHVIFGPDDRVQWSYTEWDPRYYSKGGNGKGGSGGGH